MSILIVEDDADIREDLAELLRDEGYQVSTASNGLEALQRLKTASLPCLVLLDLMMPQMDGLDFRIAQMKDDRLAQVPVVVLSGAADAREQAQNLSAIACITKPIRLEQLFTTVGKFCNHARPTTQ